MLNTLAIRNAKRSMKDYLIYVITMSVIAALMFAFDSMIFSKDIKKIYQVAGIMAVMIGLASVFIIIIVSWLINYMIRFMLEKRSKEFGTYLLIGMKKKEITHMFMRENELLCAIAFLLGIIPGMFLQQVLTTIFYSIYNMDYHLKLDYNISSIITTVLIYMSVFLLALSKNKKRFYKMNIYDMMYLDKQNDQLKENGRNNQVLFIASILYFILFDVLLVKGAITVINFWFLFAGLILSIYLFYSGISSYVVNYIKKGKSRVFKYADLFLMRQFSSKIKTMRFTMGTLTVLFTCALLGGTIAMMFNDYQEKQLNDELPFDVIVFSDTVKDNFTKQLKIIEKKAQIKDKLIYRVYEDGTDDVNQYLYKNLEYFKGKFVSPKRDSDSDKNEYFDYDTYMKLSDYNYLRKMLGLKPVKLTKNGYLIHAKERIIPYLKKFAENTTLNKGAQNLTCEGFYTEPFAQSGENGADYIIVIPNKVADRMKPFYSLLAVDLKKSVTGLQNKLAALRTYNNDDTEEMHCKITWGYGTNQIITFADTTIVKTDVTNDMKFGLAAICFPLVYVGLVFICVALTILSVQQLSDSSKFKFRYSVLRKLGLKEREVDQIIFKQLFIFYICPCLTSIGISSVIAVFLSKRFIVFTSIHTSTFEYYGMSALLFIGVYILYFIMTLVYFKRNIHV